MYVCICNGVTDEQIYQAAQAGCHDMAALTRHTGCGSTCGCCVDMAEEILHEALAECAPELSLPPHLPLAA